MENIMKTSYLRMGVAAGVALGLLSTTALAQTSLRMAHGFPPDHPHHLAAEAMVDHVAECTDSEVLIDIYPGNQLGNEAAQNEQVRIGGVDLIISALIWQAASHPPIGVSSLPYVFQDREAAISYQSSDVFRELMEGYNEATGLHMLSAGYQGAFNISTSDVAIESLEDAQGVRIRAPDTPLFMAFPPAIGAVAVPIPFAELYLALQQGVAQGSLNPITNTYSLSLYEVQDYIALTEHLIEFMGMIASGPTWERLNEEQRLCLQEGADIFAQESADRNIALEDELKERMVAEGLVQITQPDKEEFIEATEDLRRSLMEEYGWSEELVERIRALD